MKFHRIRIKNLNSLYGTQSIDFEKDIRDSSLFLIVGPTGAGKSTILDAICLALFGKTPRLDRSMGQADREIGHVMSLGTAECVAELEFSTLAQGKRRRYEASWSLRRAHGNPDGTMQRPERSLTRQRDDGTTELLVSDERAKFFDPVFDRALQGLTIEDFTRSMLLAQGEFAAFLHAGDEEKASILERLTSTDQYKLIGSRAAARRRELEARQRELVQETRDVGLSVESRAELEEELVATASALEERRKSLETARKISEWMKRREELSREVEQTDEKLEKQRGAIEELAEDIGKLTRDEELSPIEEDLRELVNARARRVSELERLEKLEETLEAKRKETAETRERAEKLEKTLEEARKRRDEAAPRLRRYEKLAERKAAARKEFERSQRGLQELHDQERKLKQKLEELAGSRQEDVDNLKGLEESLAAHPLAKDADRGEFDDSLAAIEHRVKAVLEDLGRRREELERADASVEKARETYETRVEESRGSTGDLATKQGVVTRARNKLESHLDGQSVSERRQQLDSQSASLASRVTALKEARYVLDRIRKLETERDDLHRSIEQLRAEIEAISSEEANLKDLETTRRSLLEEIERRLELSNQIEVLNRLRTELETGEPCPLCGSPLHPYCESEELATRAEVVEEERSEDAEKLADVRAGLKETGQKIQANAAKYVSRTTSLRHQEGRLAELQNQLEVDHKTFAMNAEQGGFPPLEIFRLKQSDALGVALDAAQEDQQELKEVIEEFEKHAQAYEKARQKLDAARDQHEDEHANELKSELDAVVAKREVAARELQNVEARLAGLGDEVEALYGRFGMSGAVEDVKEALARLRDKRKRLGERLKEAEEHRERLRQLDERLEARREELTKLEKSLDERRDEHEERESAVTQVDEAIAELLGDTTLAELTGWGERAQKLEEQVKTRRSEIEQIVKVEAELSARRKAAAEAAEALSEQAKALEERLTSQLDSMEAEASNIDEALEYLLEPEKRVDLRRRVQAARDKLGQLEESLAASKKKLEEHLESQPDELPESRELAMERVERLEKEVAELTRSLGALEEKKRADDAIRERLKEKEEELEELQKDLDTWVPIAQLIGVNDGDSFKQFAQTLNLEGLIEKANYRLERLHPRYELAVARVEGSPTLDFSVVDKYQARTERPLTTLSGGETFLVSLALALALADYRRIEFPVETLLLDEGFGTLDQDSLRMAVNTLHQLHRDGTRQIGIISHVEALKDMVDSRIVVDKTGQGRSVIRFEEGASQLAG